jgi:hypothetical protein
VTFADSVLHLVRAGARIDSPSRPDKTAAIEDSVADEVELAAVQSALAAALPVPVELPDTIRALDLEAQTAQDAHRFEPGLPDLEAAVSLVSAGLAKRVVLSGFPSWPGLLWRAYQLADTTGVQILPTVVRPGGKVDIVITRDIATNG